jgi:hypothetical protein
MPRNVPDVERAGRMMGRCLAGPDRGDEQLKHVHETAIAQVLQTPKLRRDRRLCVIHQLAYLGHAIVRRVQMQGHRAIGEG